MSVQLTSEDWERIVFALSHFNHNRDFLDTLERVQEWVAQNVSSDAR